MLFELKHLRARDDWVTVTGLGTVTVRSFAFHHDLPSSIKCPTCSKNWTA
jgi:hypothetical protein